MNQEISPKIRIALYEPRIPQNTGNIGRTCGAFKITLDLIEPLGFSLDNKFLKRAGLDYWEYININVHKDYGTFKNSLNKQRLIGFSKEGGVDLNTIEFKYDDVLLFGREDIGLTNEVKRECNILATIPMPGVADEDGNNGIRSLNLSSASAIASYTALMNINSSM